MAYLQRIALILLLTLPAFLPKTVLADYPKTNPEFLLNSLSTYHATYTEACSEFLLHYQTLYPSHNYVQTTCNDVQVNLQGYEAGWGNKYPSSAIIKYGTCGTVKSQWDNGICTGEPPSPTCTPPLIYDSGSNTCKDPCDPKKWKPVSYFTVGQTWVSACYEGCQVEGQSGDCGFNAAGIEGCFYDGRFTGVSCTGDEAGTGVTPPDPGDTPEYDCVKQGKSWGTVNGVTVCVAAGTPGSSPTTSTTPKTSSSTTTSSTDSAGATSTSSSTGNGSKISTFNGDGTVTTSESKTTTNSDGTAKTTQETKTQPVADFCKDNPNVEQCKAAAKCTYTSSCADGIVEDTCEGDAAACAIAQHTADLNCKFGHVDPELRGIFDALANADVKDNPADSSNRITINVPESLDDSTPFGAACPDDMYFTFFGRDIKLPISQWCPYLAWVGNVFLALAYLYGARALIGSL
jgi:hypothetical protein